MGESPIDARGIIGTLRAVRGAWQRSVALLLVLSLGLHWAVLQTVAWTGMLVSYTRDNGLSRAISMTFDGRHPCALCKVVQQGQAGDQQPDRPLPSSQTKLEAGLVWQGWHWDFHQVTPPVAAPDLTAPVRAFAPPKPRPRLGLPSLTA